MTKLDPQHRAQTARHAHEASPGAQQLPLGSGAFVSPLVAPRRSPLSRRVRLVRAMLCASACLALATVLLALIVAHKRGVEPPVRFAASGPALTPPPRSAHSPAMPADTASRLRRVAERDDVGQPSLTSIITVEPIDLTPSPPSERAAAPRPPQRATTGKQRQARKAMVPELPSRSQVLARMKRVRPSLERCLGGTRGVVVTARLRFAGTTGHVVGVTAEGAPAAIAPCIERALRRARLPRFASDDLEITYPFSLP